MINTAKVEDLIKEAAELFIKPRFQNLADHEVQEKTSAYDLVTRADIEAEEFLAPRLAELLPGSVCIGEEAVSQVKSNMAPLKDDKNMVWVIDPVDGTNNFVRGDKTFGVMVSLVMEGEARFGWIYDVMADEMSVAEKGQGASFSGEALKVRQIFNPPDMNAHINYRFFPKNLQPHIKEASQSFGQTQSLGCAAHEYIRIAKGLADVSLYSRLKPWDHLAGTLIVQEAGGYVAKIDGSAYTPKDDYAGLIVTTSQKAWKRIRSLLFDNKDIKENIKNLI